MVALAYSIELNRGYTGLWASVAGNVVTIQSRSLGLAGNSTTLCGIDHQRRFYGDRVRREFHRRSRRELATPT